LTKSVHPYCRLAIITMQTMPTKSCTSRTDPGRASGLAVVYDILELLPEFVVF
jgi:hypothetical protein